MAVRNHNALMATTPPAPACQHPLVPQVPPFQPPNQRQQKAREQLTWGEDGWVPVENQLLEREIQSKAWLNTYLGPTTPTHVYIGGGVVPMIRALSPDLILRALWPLPHESPPLGLLFPFPKACLRTLKSSEPLHKGAQSAHRCWMLNTLSAPNTTRAPISGLTVSLGSQFLAVWLVCG